MSTRYYILSLIVLSFCSNLTGQFSVNKYPVRFCQYYNNFSLVNPANTGSYSDLKVAFGGQQLLGNFSKVSTMYFNAAVRVGKTRNSHSPFSAFGVKLYNDREGKYLNRSRFYFIYAWHAYLSRDVLFSGGLEVGGMNYSVKGSDLTFGGGDLAPDGAVGVQVYNKSFHFGISYNQIFNSKIQPLEEIAILSNYLNFSGSKKISIGEEFTISPSTSVRYQLDDSRIYLDFNLNLNINQRLFYSLGLHNNNILVNSIGLKQLNTGIGKFGLEFSYAFPIRKMTLNTNIAEIGLVFYGKDPH